MNEGEPPPSKSETPSMTFTAPVAKIAFSRDPRAVSRQIPA